ncbi:hypothetical protein OPIT5_10900 [Opitutaceae bacterium TAV5]|nr:hypothetical protein OPIT5_10900 [Opitutaceae bacterium TAV5]
MTIGGTQGTGRLSITGYTLTMGSTSSISLGVGANAQEGTLEVNAGGSVIAGGLIQLGYAGTLTVNSGGTVSSTNDLYVGNTASGTGYVTVDGGSLTMNTITLGRQANASGYLEVSNGGSVTANTLTLGSGSTYTGYLYIGGRTTTKAAGTLNVATVAASGNNSELHFNHTNTDYRFVTKDGGVIAITGKVKLRQDAGTTILEAASTYTGGTQISGGTLLVDNADSDTSGTGTGAVEVQAGGALGGAGRISGAVTVHGTLQDARNTSILNFANDVTLASDATVSLALGGQTRGEDYWSFTVAAGKTLTLGGTLNVSFLEDLVLTDGQSVSFTLFSAETAGSFSSVALPYTWKGSSLDWDTTQLASAGVLSVIASAVVPEPRATGILIGLAAIAGLLAVRKIRAARSR